MYERVRYDTANSPDQLTMENPVLIEISSPDGSKFALDPAFVTGVKVANLVPNYILLIYCDTTASDANGGSGSTPRYTCGPYGDQSQIDAVFDRIVSAANEARKQVAAP